MPSMAAWVKLSRLSNLATSGDGAVSCTWRIVAP
jgi:hypothetical protein